MSNTSTSLPDLPSVGPQPVTVGNPLSTRELTELLIKHNALHDGHYELLVEFMIGAGNMGPSPETAAPSAIVTVSKFGLVNAQLGSVSAVDASVVNPAKKRRTAKK